MDHNPAIHKDQPVVHNQDVFYQDGGHPFDHQPAEWLAYLETLPFCHKCQVRHVHLPQAKTCLDCLGSRPGLMRRRRMNEILHNGGFYCSRCFIREAPPGFPCIRCHHMRAVAHIRRSLTQLFVQAQQRFVIAFEAVITSVAADTYLVADREALSAATASEEALDIVHRIHELWARMAALDVAKAEAAMPELIHGYEQSAEVGFWVTEAWNMITIRLATQDYNDAHLLIVKQEDGVPLHDN